MHQNKRKNYTKKNISKNIFEDVGLPHSFSYSLLDNLLDIFKNILLTDKKLIIKNFGTFVVNNKKSRMGRNPKTRKKHHISERKVVTFKASDSLKYNLNKV